ncbi:hypothetical protein [Massilia sp. TSP1-1-2]|uniref:hypothetical protein n=1 Tax=unclassified Massilia TaxID=2609279 RepID=UPI003CE9C83F
MLQCAAILLAALALAHSYLGERYLLMRLFRRSEHLPPLLGGTDFTKNTLRFVWHLVTVLALGFALVLVHIADHRDGPAIARLIGVLLLVSGALPLVITRARHLSWVVLFAAGALCLAWAAL